MVEYVIGPGDNLNISVWQQSDLSASVPVRPDGKVTLPLVEDMQAAGKTPTRLARDIEQALGEFIREPRVTVIVTSVAEAEKREQVRVIGQAMSPSAVAYRDGMSVLDVMIAVGGLTDFAAGNRAILIRVIDGERREFNLRLNDLVNRGDMSADVAVLPGDVIVIPESRF
ncbi:MAG: polysaccharide export protein [Wenzhouxiangella sp.]|nr:polysaccharide export protein [Wenzhouxiangella sp.]TVR93389.1 MAG: sugar ABC transporter substrate-binding protein [Wenzhouxiangellaceae bacterium]